jgi:hypothetical protein
MVQAGAQPLTAIAYVSELQRDWARPTADEVAKLFAEHGGGFGQGLRWEWQLLALKEGTRYPPAPVMVRRHGRCCTAKQKRERHHEGHRQGANRERPAG